MSIYNNLIRFKGLLFLLAMLIITLMFFYTDKIIDNLRADSRRLIELHANFIADFAHKDVSGEMDYLFNQVIQKINFPIVIADTRGNPIFWKSVGVGPNDHSPEAMTKIRKIIRRMDTDTDPVGIKYEDRVINYIHFGDSQLIRSLSWFPYIQMLAVALFILVGYVGFRNIQRSEQRSTWVGMAKETAHQLGTPLSSLMGWTELLKDKVSPDGLKTIVEMENDIERLAKVSHRFSQIGFATDMKLQPLKPVVGGTVAYFNRRLPHMAKEIVLNEHTGEVPNIYINQQLFEWALENLIKNAIDAIDRKDGRIDIKTFAAGNTVVIEVADNGKGLPKNKRSTVFDAGYTTKRRGWGMGLSLVKRIIKDYHRGRVFVKETETGKGTTFRIELPVRR